MGIGLVGGHCLAVDLVLVAADIWRIPGQYFAQDGPEAEHIASRVEPIHLSAGLLRGHVRRCPQHAPGPSRWRWAPGPTGSVGGPEPPGTDHRHVARWRLLPRPPARPSSLRED